MLLLALVLCAGVAHSMSPTECRQALADASRTLDRAIAMEKARPGSSKTQVDGLARSIGSSAGPVSRGRQSVSSSLAEVASRLHSVGTLKGAERLARLRRVSEYVRTLRYAADKIPTNDPKQIAKARAILGQELTKGEYHESPSERLMVRIMEGIANALSTVFGSGGASVFGWIVLGIVLLAFIGAIVYSILRVNWGSVKPLQEADARPARRVRPSAEALLAQAERAAAEGRYRDAFRSIYLASILLLDKKHLLNYTDGGTNWEYIRAMSRQAPPEVTAIFSDMTRLFDDLVYGQREISSEEYSSGRNGYSRLEELT